MHCESYGRHCVRGVSDLEQALTAILGLVLDIPVCLHEQLLHNPRHIAIEGDMLEGSGYVLLLDTVPRYVYRGMLQWA